MIAVRMKLHEEALSAAIASRKAVFYEPPVSHPAKPDPGSSCTTSLSAPQATFANLELGFHPGFARAADMIRDRGDWKPAENHDNPSMQAGAARLIQMSA